MHLLHTLSDEVELVHEFIELVLVSGLVRLFLETAEEARESARQVIDTGWLWSQVGLEGTLEPLGVFQLGLQQTLEPTHQPSRTQLLFGLLDDVLGGQTLWRHHAGRDTGLVVELVLLQNDGDVSGLVVVKQSLVDHVCSDLGHVLPERRVSCHHHTDHLRQQRPEGAPDHLQSLLYAGCLCHQAGAHFYYADSQGEYVPLE